MQKKGSISLAHKHIHQMKFHLPSKKALVSLPQCLYKPIAFHTPPLTFLRGPVQLLLILFTTFLVFLPLTFMHAFCNLLALALIFSTNPGFSRDTQMPHALQTHLNQRLGD